MAENGSVWMNLLMDYMDKTHLEKINEIFTKYEEKIFATNYNFDEIKNLLKQYIPEMLDSDYKILENRLNNIRQTVLDKIREAENINLSAADFQDDFSSITEVNVIEKREKLLKAIESDITHDSPVGTEMFKEKNDAFYEHRSPYYAPTVNVSLFGDLLGLKKFIDTDINDKSWEGYIKERVKVIKFPIDSNIKVLEFGLHFTQNVYNITNNYDQIQKTNRDYTGRIYLSNLLEEDKQIECRLIIYNADNDPWRKTDNTIGPEFYFKCFRKDGFIYLFCDQIEIFRVFGVWKKISNLNPNYLGATYTQITSYESPDVYDEHMDNTNADLPGRGQKLGLEKNISVAWGGSVVSRTKTVNNVALNGRMQSYKTSIAMRDHVDLASMLGSSFSNDFYSHFSNFDLFVRNRNYQSKLDNLTCLRFVKNMYPKLFPDELIRIYSTYQGHFFFTTDSNSNNNWNTKNASIILSMQKDLTSGQEWDIDEMLNVNSTVLGWEMPYIYTSETISYNPITIYNVYKLPSKAEKKWQYIQNQKQILIMNSNLLAHSKTLNGRSQTNGFVNYPCSVYISNKYENQTHEQYHYSPILLSYSNYRLPLRTYDFEVVQANNSYVDYAWFWSNKHTKVKCKLDISLDYVSKTGGFVNDRFVDESDENLILTLTTFPKTTGWDPVLTVSNPTPSNLIQLVKINKGEPLYEDYDTTGIVKYKIKASSGVIPKGNIHVSVKGEDFYLLPVQKEILLTCKAYSKLVVGNVGSNNAIKLSANSAQGQKNTQKIDIQFNAFTYEYEIRDLDIIEFNKETKTIKGLKAGETILTLSAQEDGNYIRSKILICVKVVDNLAYTNENPVVLERDELDPFEFKTIEERYDFNFRPQENYWKAELQQIDEIEIDVEENDKIYHVDRLFEGNQLIDKRYNYLLARFDSSSKTREHPGSQGVDADRPKLPGDGQIIIEEYMKWVPSTIEMIGKRLFVYFVKTDKTSYYKKPIGGFEKSFFPYEEMLENYLFLNGRKIDVTAYPEYEGLYNAYKEAKYITEEGEAVDTYLDLDIPETTNEDPLVINRHQFQDIIIDSNANDFTITNDPANANFVTNAKLTDGRFGFKLTGANIGSQKVKISATSTAGKTVTKDIFVKCVEEKLTQLYSGTNHLVINAVNGGANSKTVHIFTDAEYTGSNGNVFNVTGQTNGVTISEWKDNGLSLKKGENDEFLRDISFKIYYPFNASHAFPQKQNLVVHVTNNVGKRKVKTISQELRITKETPSFAFVTKKTLLEVLTCDSNIYSYPEELTIGERIDIWMVENINTDNREYLYPVTAEAGNADALQVTKHTDISFSLLAKQKGFNTVTWKLTKDDIVYKKTLQFRCKELTELTTDLEGDSIDLWPAKNTTIEVTTNANDFTAEVEDTTKATVVKVNNQLSITSLDVGSTNLIIKAHADDAIQNTLTIPINVTAVPNTRLEVDATELTLDLGFNQRLTIDTEAEEWEYEILSGADYLNLVKTNDTTLVVQAVDIGESRIKIKAQHGELVESSVEIPVTVKYVTTELSIGNRTEYEILKDETLVFEIQTNADDFTYIEDTELVETPEPEPEAPTEGEDTDQVEQQPEQEIKKKRLKFTKGRGKLTVQGINPGNQKFSISATALNGDTKTIEVTIDVFEETTTFEITPESTKRRLKLGETQIFTINNSASDYTVIIPEEVKDCLTYDKSKHLLTCTKVCDTTLTFEAKEDGKKKIVKEVKVSANYPFAELNLTEDQLKTRVENLDQIFIELHKNKTNREEYNKTIDKLKNSFPEAEFTVDEESVPAFQLSENTKATLETYKTNVPTLDVYNNEIQEYYNAMPRSLNLVLDDKTLARIHAVQTRNTNLQNTSYINTVRRHNLELNLLLTSDESWDWVDGSYKTDVYQRMGNCKVGLKTKTIGDSPSEEELLIHRQSLNAHLTKLRDNHRNYFTLKNYTEFKSNVIANNYALSPIVMLKGEILDEEGNPPEKLSGKSVRTFDTTPWVDKDYISEITMTNSNPDVVDVEVAENLKSITFTHKNNGKGESDVELTLKRVVEIHPTELTVDKDKLEFTLIAPPKKEETVTPEEGNPNPDGTEQPEGDVPVDQVPTEEETVVQESQTIIFTTNAPTFTIEAEDPEQGIVDILIDTENPDVKAAKITPIKEGTIKLIAKATAVSEIPTTSYKEATVEINITVNPPVEEVVPPAPEVPTPDPSLPEGGDQTEQIPDQGETKEGEPTPQADESLDGGPTVDVDPDGGTEETPEVPEEPESKVETVEYTQTVNVRVMCLEDTNSKLVFDELFNKDKKFTLYKFDNSEATEDYVMNYNTVVLDNLMSIIDEYILDIRVPEYGRWKGQWPIYMLRPDVTLDVDETKTEEELLYEAYEKVQLSTLPEHIKKVYERNKATIKSINDFCQNVANKDNFLKENTLYRCVGFDATTNIPDSWAREHNLTLVNNVINRYKNEFTNASEIKYTGKLYHILATGTWDPIIVKKNRHQLMCIEICFKNLFPKHTEFKLLDSKDMKKINTKKVYANEVWFDHDDLGEDILPFGLDPDYETPEKQLSVGLDLQSVLDYIYLKYSGDDRVSLLDTSKKYRVNMKYRASDFTYDVGGTDNNKKNVMVAVTRLIKSLLHNNNDQTKNETKFTADIFEKLTNGQATDIYFEDNYRIGVNTVGDLITWMKNNKDVDFKYPYMDSRNIQAYRLDPRYIDTPEGEKIYDTNGRKCFYSEDLEEASRANRGILTYPKVKWFYSDEDVLPFGIDIEDGGWVSKKSYDSSVAFLFTNTDPHHIYRSTDGFNWQKLQVRQKGVDLWIDENSYFEDLQVNHDGSFVVLLDAQGRCYYSVNMPRAGEEEENQVYEFREMTDASHNTSGARFSFMIPLTKYWQDKGGYGIGVAHDGHPVLWRDNMKHIVTHLATADTQTYPRMFNTTMTMAPNFTFDLKSINSYDSVGTRHMTVCRSDAYKILHDSVNQPLIDGNNNLVDTIYSRSTENIPINRFGIDFELLLSLSDTSVFSTDYDFEILNRGEVLELTPTNEKDNTTFEIKSSDAGLIQLDGFDYSASKVNMTGPYVIKKQFMNFYVNPSYTLNRIVSKTPEELKSSIKEYILHRITMSGWSNALVMMEMTVIFDFPVDDSRRTEIDKARKMYHKNFFSGEPTTKTWSYTNQVAVDGLEFNMLGVYDKDEAKTRFVRYYKNLARFRNQMTNVLFTMDNLKEFYNLDTDILKKVFFTEDNKIKLSELVYDPFVNLDESNILKYPTIVNVTIYPTDVQSFVNFRQKINRDLFNKYEKDGDIITTKTDVLFNKEEE